VGVRRVSRKAWRWAGVAVGRRALKLMKFSYSDGVQYGLGEGCETDTRVFLYSPEGSTALCTYRNTWDFTIGPS
jgi:hypothetical protein